MPQAIVGAAIAGAFKLAAGATLAAALTAAATTLVLGGLSTLFAPDPPSSPSFDISQGGLTRQIREPITERRMIYGEARTSGPIVFISTTNNNKFLHMVIALADHECQGIDECIINEESIPADRLSGSGLVNAGRYANRVRIKYHLGQDNQAADSDLVAEVAEWTTNHRLRGITYAYVRLEWNRDLWPGGIPTISFWVKGRKVAELREPGFPERWTTNIPLIITDYLRDVRRGVGISLDDINQAQTNSSANAADEQVYCTPKAWKVTSVATSTDIFTLEGDVLELQTGDTVRIENGQTPPGGTSIGEDYFVIVYQRMQTPRVKLAETYEDALMGNAVNITSTPTGSTYLRRVAEPRYAGGGIVKLNQAPEKIIKELAASMAGKVIKSGAQWRVCAGVWASPTVTLTEDDLAGPIQIQTRQSHRDRFNRVQGIYASPINFGQPTDYPVYNNLIMQENDGEVVSKQLNLPYTPRPYTCQRIAKSATERVRQEIIVTAPWKLKAFELQAGDNTNMTFPDYGWEDKPFEVLDWQLSIEGDDEAPNPVINMTLKETAAYIFEFDSAEEQVPDPAPNSNLPNGFEVLALQGFALDSRKISTEALDNIYVITASWLAPLDSFVASGGQVELQFKPSSSDTWRPSFFVDGELVETDVFQAELNTQYDVRIRPVNFLGVPGGWNTILNFVVGSSGGITENNDWGRFSESIVDSEDWGLYSDGVLDTDDFGAFS